MKVTIAIPTYNRTQYLDQVLAGATQQTFHDYEILIGDSSSNDNVLEHVEPYFTDGRMRYLRLPPATTLLSKLNELLDKALGEWMVFLCDDDLLDADYLNVLMEHVRHEPLATLVRCRFKIIDGEGNLLRLDPVCQSVMRPSEFLSHLFLPERKFFKMNVSAILFRRQTLLEEGGFREFPLAWHSDLLAWALVGSRGLSLFEKQCLASIRVHPDSQTSSYGQDMMKALQTNFGVNDALKHLFARLGQEVTDPEDRALVRVAERNAKNYMLRHLTRIFDHGFLEALSTDRPGLNDHVESLLEQMTRMGVPRFKSEFVYSCLGQLAYPVRRPMLDALKWCKTKKWCS